MWYLSIHRYAVPREEAQGVLNDHLSWIHKQHQIGRVLFSGPTSDKSLGIMVVKAMSLEDAQEVLSTDPFVREGYRTYELYEWDAHHVLGAGGFTTASLQLIKEERQRLDSM